jgi:HAD superfamily hydrolase (TIGR01509 family)
VSLRDRPRSVEAVTFDVGLTLLFRPDRVLRRRLSGELTAWLQERGMRLESDRYRRLRSEAELTFARLSADGREHEASKAIDDFVTALQLELTDGDRAELQRMLEHFFRDFPTRPTDGAVDALRCLHERGVKLGIVSNRGRRPGWMTRQYLEICGLASFFEPAAIAWSDEVGWRKPDPRIFLVALRALGTVPQRAAHVGDSARRDVVPARDLGMTAIHYVGLREDAAGARRADAVISHYRELPATLGLVRPPER